MTEALVKTILEKSKTHIDVFNVTKDVFEKIKLVLQQKEQELKSAATESDPRIAIEYIDKGRLEVHFKAGNDVLVFLMHASVFQIDDANMIHKNSYIKENPMRAFCGMICVYNFMADSFKFNRVEDAGMMVSRIFVNCDNHFFMEGKKQLGIIYNKLDTDIITDAAIDSMVEANLSFCAEADLFIPPFATMAETTLEALNNRSISNIDSSRRFGFVQHLEKTEVVNKKITAKE
ncbi:MAG: hypothetical protein IPP29_09430 [Bacteroidetes bacterium]|nr:hypothetical protein [Bacteroidota bacterium]